MSSDYGHRNQETDCGDRLQPCLAGKCVGGELQIQHGAHKTEISAVALINFAHSNQYYANAF